MRDTLVTIFDGVKDPRKIDRCTYELGDLFSIAFHTCLSDGEDYVDMALFAKHRARDFGLLSYTDRNPSTDTFERLFSILKPEFVEECVVKHGRRILDILNEKQIAIDGRKRRQGTTSATRIFLWPGIMPAWHTATGRLRMHCTGILMSHSRKTTAVQGKRTLLRICRCSGSLCFRLSREPLIN